MVEGGSQALNFCQLMVLMLPLDVIYTCISRGGGHETRSQMPNPFLFISIWINERMQPIVSKFVK